MVLKLTFFHKQSCILFRKFCKKNNFVINIVRFYLITKMAKLTTVLINNYNISSIDNKKLKAIKN